MRQHIQAVSPGHSARFEELRDLCTEAATRRRWRRDGRHDGEHVLQARMHEASQLASENMALVESIGDPALTIALSFAGSSPSTRPARPTTSCDGPKPSSTSPICDPERAFILGSPLAMRLAWRGVAASSMGTADGAMTSSGRSRCGRASGRGVPGRDHRLQVCRDSRGVFLADDSALREIDWACRLAERVQRRHGGCAVRMTFGMALVRATARIGQTRLRHLAHPAGNVHQGALRVERHLGLDVLPCSRVGGAGPRRRGGPAMAGARTEEMIGAGQLCNFDLPLMSLAETLIFARHYDEAATSRAASTLAAHVANGFIARLFGLRLRALLAQARGERPPIANSGTATARWRTTRLRGPHGVGRGDA